MEMHQRGELPIERLCKVYPVENMDGALCDLRMANVIKFVIKW